VTERILTLFFLLVNCTYLLYALQLTSGNLQSPKSGFLPLLTAVTALILILLIIIRQRSLKILSIAKNVDWTKFLFIIIGLFFYIIILDVIGYFAATFILLLYLFKIGDIMGWLLPFTLTVTSATLFYLLFNYYLAVPLP